MNSKIDWKIFLNEHSLFSALKETEIDKILVSTISMEKSYEGNQTVFRMGESGDSLFLIGSGSVAVSLPEADNKMIPLTILRKGEFFGEIAVFDHRPRSATVITNEPSLFLEIQGQELLNLIHDHPEIEFKLLMHLSTRLRDVSDQVLAVKVKEIDEKINNVYTRLDIEQKTIDASLKATQTVFDHTSKRASEVIESVERSRSQMAAVASIIAGALSIVVAVLGMFGFSKFQDVNKIFDKVNVIHATLEDRLKDGEKIALQIDEIAPKIASSIKRFKEADHQIKYFQKDITNALLTRFYNSVDEEMALKAYERILKIADIGDTDNLFRFIHMEISERKNLPLYGYVLHEGITNNHRQKILSFYLLLTALALIDDTIRIGESQSILKFTSIENDLRVYLATHPEPIKHQLKEDFSIKQLKNYLGTSDQPITDESKEIKQIRKIWELIL